MANSGFLLQLPAQVNAVAQLLKSNDFFLKKKKASKVKANEGAVKTQSLDYVKHTLKLTVYNICSGVGVH